MLHNETLRLEDGKAFVWEFLDPAKLMQHIVSSSESLQRVYLRAAKRRPPSQDRPWRLVVGFDEFVQGNKLNVLNARKSMCLYFSTDQSTKKMFLGEIKRNFDTVQRKWPDISAGPYITKLPHTTDEFQQFHREVYNAVYVGDDKPVACQIEYKELIEFDASYTCRGWKKEASAMMVQPMQHHGGSVDALGGLGSILAVAMQMMQQQNQNINLQMLGQAQQGQ